MQSKPPRRDKMKLHWEPLSLELRTTFRVAHGPSTHRYNVLVYLDDGVGEAATVPYYGETQEGIIEYLKSGHRPLRGEVWEWNDASRHIMKKAGFVEGFPLGVIIPVEWKPE